MTAVNRERAEARRVASQVDPARHWPVVVTRRHALPRDSWKLVLREELAAAVARYLAEHGGLPPELAERAGQLTAADQLRDDGATRAFLTAEQLAYYAAEAAR